MFFWKKLCRLNGESTSTHRRARNQQQHVHTNTATTYNFELDATTAGADALHCYEEASTLGIDALERSQRRTINGNQLRLRRRTPPPEYHTLPTTPPPSYTPRGSDIIVEARPSLAAVEAAAVQRSAACAAASINESAVHRIVADDNRNNNHSHNNNNNNLIVAGRARSDATAAIRQRRRQRLQQLQQQRFANILNTSSTDSTSSDDNNANANVNVRDRNGLGTAVNARRRRPRERRAAGVHGLRDAYCPDLLHACALILNQPTISSDSSVANFTPTPPAFDYSSDYVEIDELLHLAIQAPSTPPSPPTPAAAQLQRAKSTPALDCNQQTRSCYNAHSSAVATTTTGRQNLAMGQNLSLRRPRISLTWVLREQQQQQQQQDSPAQQPQQNEPNNDTQETTEKNDTQSNGGSLADNRPPKLPPPPPPPLSVAAPPTFDGHVITNGSLKQRTEAVPTQLDVSKKRYRIKQLPNGTEPLNGYATTPTAHMAPSSVGGGSSNLAPQKFFSNQNLMDYKDKAARNTHHNTTKELLFVCTPQRAPKSYMDAAASEAMQLARKRNEIRKRLASKLQLAQQSDASTTASTTVTHVPNPAAAATTATKLLANGGGSSTTTLALAGVRDNEVRKSLKITYSEPSLIAASECAGGGSQLQQQQRRHRHRKRRERSRLQKFGYEIHNVDEFLSKCSLASPGNIPVVLATASTLYQTRPGGYQLEIPLPLGMVVNAVFKNQNWLYVQTPHAEEGYVGYACCLPLGILPPAARGGNSKHTPCWESNVDVFPRPCGNMTDSEKEIRLRGGTRSDGARTPRQKPDELLLGAVATHNNNNNNNNCSNSFYGEQHVDKLYLRAASQPKLVEKAYAQLRSTKSATASVRSTSQDEYVTLQQQQPKSSKLYVQKQQPSSLHVAQRVTHAPSYITNGHNGQHLHPKSAAASQPTANAAANATMIATTATTTTTTVLNMPQSVLNALRRQQQNGLRQTLVAINTDYVTDSIAVHKGEIVTLCECRESKDHRQWFYVKTRDGREGFIPAEVAGHGYL